MLASSASNDEQAEALLIDALHHCRSQSSLAWELRVAIDLANLERSKTPERGRRLLAEAFQRFDEGFDTADLRAARLCLGTVDH